MTDSFPIRKVDHVRFFCGNAMHTAEWYRRLFGFDIQAYAGLETGMKDEANYLLTENDVRFLMSTPLLPDHPLAEQLGRHGDFVQDIAFEVDDVDLAFKTATSRGAKAFSGPRTLEDSFGKVRIAAIHTYGDVVHSLVNRDDFSGLFLPGFRPVDKKGDPVGIEFVDHCVGNVEWNGMNKWVDWYANILGFEQIQTFDDKDISTEYTALMSKVMQSGNGRVKFPINEPAEGRKRSQIEEYLIYHGGPGVQHVALHTSDIINTIKLLKSRGMEFLQVPRTYYDTLFERVGEIDEDLNDIADLGILVDRDEEGYLLQLFSKPVEDRPTLFYEFIERKGAKSFGKGNFKALFEAIEREQALRGTL
ncbi:MAG: 4-hydroxyphenylpyruvate dioxygenase [Armatimonadetes bacterium]|nr:4-hydroxyphenylpyruvate dioxygenase [Armatimonadota bacterium]